jgi:hypothetical protein
MVGGSRGSMSTGFLIGKFDIRRGSNGSCFLTSSFLLLTFLEGLVIAVSDMVMPITAAFFEVSEVADGDSHAFSELAEGELGVDTFGALIFADGGLVEFEAGAVAMVTGAGFQRVDG